MVEFKSGSQYRTFSDFVMRKARHVRDSENQQFLDTVLETSAKRVEIKTRGESLWRAQLHHELDIDAPLDDNNEEIYREETPVPTKPERMKPQPDRASEGRVNPKGIPCLYCSTDEKTAMTEARPWIGSYVSLGKFVITKDLRLVDCWTDEKDEWWLVPSETHLSPQRREEYVWRDINRAFAMPVTRNDDIAEYAPTQVLAEAFKSHGYDGIIYGSRLGKGKTVAIFDPQAAKLIQRTVYQVKSVDLGFTEGRTYMADDDHG
jgi:hypothetical protein